MGTPDTRDLTPELEFLDHLLSVGSGGEQLVSGAKIRHDWAIGREKALGVPCGLELAHVLPSLLANGLPYMPWPESYGPQGRISPRHPTPLSQYLL